MTRMPQKFKKWKSDKDFEIRLVWRTLQYSDPCLKLGSDKIYQITGTGVCIGCGVMISFGVIRDGVMISFGVIRDGS